MEGGERGAMPAAHDMTWRGMAWHGVAGLLTGGAPGGRVVSGGRLLEAVVDDDLWPGQRHNRRHVLRRCGCICTVEGQVQAVWRGD